MVPDPVCDMSNRHVSHRRPMDVVQSAYTPSQIEWNFHDLFILLLSSDLPTVRQFLLKQTQLKCVTLGHFKYTIEDEIGTDTVVHKDEPEVTEDVIDTVKVLKCYGGIAT